MTILRFLNPARRGLHQSALSSFGAVAAALLFPVFAMADEPLVTNVGRFEIPFEIGTDPGQKPAGFAVLFGSQDGGRNWEKLNSVPATSGSFTFSAPRDGRYSFAVRTTDAQGNLQDAIQGCPPELDVVVDTVAPDIRLNLLDAGNGQVVINWIIQDATIVPQTLMIEVADGTDGRWKPVPLTAAASGQVSVQALAGSVVSVRSAARDAAGNQGESSAQMVLRGIDPKANVVPGYPLPPSVAMPLGPSPFPALKTTSDHSTSRPRSQPIPSAPNTLPVAGDFNAAVSLPPILSNQESSVTAQPDHPQPRTALPDLSALNSAKEQPFPAAFEAQIVNHHVFDLEYQVDDVGPSGVSAVELFITEDAGQHWFTYGNDQDLESPVQIDTRGEGTFGFAVRVRNGLGISDDAPQPGQAPEMVVTVDESLPEVQLAQPALRTDGFGTIQLSWKVRELHPSSSPVRLEYAAAPNGPWTLIFDWQPDQGEYQWGIRSGMPTQLYFRLFARDAAGNVATVQTVQPLIVDLRRPVGRLLRVQTVSQPRTGDERATDGVDAGQ